MSRSGYYDDYCDNRWPHIMWRGRVASATRGKRGQRLLLDLVEALDALPEKRLIRDQLILETGEVCALGAIGLKRGVVMWGLNPDDNWDFDPDEHADHLSGAFNAAACLIREIVYMNDEVLDRCSPEQRWQRMRAWAVKQLRPVDLVDLPDPAPPKEPT